ncbi:MAG: hypothetical protein KF683_22950 [Rubrivivax sp.]|nr:hypothetical protein [Rubrivivax sp.]
MKTSQGPAASERLRWQRRLLPLMVWMLAGLTVFFFISTLIQLLQVQQRIVGGPAIAAPQVLRAADCPAGWSADLCLSLRSQDTAALLEADVVAKRYHQANVIVMSSIWSRYLGFITGMTLALVGAAFILGQIDVPPSELQGQGAGWTVSLKTASPGLALVLVGAVLMIVAMVTLHEVKTSDAAVYLPRGSGPAAGAGLPSLALEPTSPAAPAAGPKERP